MFKKLTIICFALVSFVTGQTVWACSPEPDAEPQPIAKRVDNAALVFEGVVVEIDEDTAVVDAKKYFKGNGPTQVRISGYNTDSCSDFLEPERHALFFAEGNPEDGLNAVYDGEFGSVREVTKEALEEILHNQEQNSMLNGENCTALFDNGSLYVPCVKIAGSDDVYNVKFDLVRLGHSALMRFDLAKFKKLLKPKSELPVDFEIQPSYAAVEDVYVNTKESLSLQSTLEANVIIKGYLRNGCEKLNPYTQDPISSNSNGNFNITLTSNSSTDTDIACTDAIEPYSVSIPLDINGLSAGVYSVTVNKEHNARFMLKTDDVLSEGDNNVEEGDDNEESK